MADDFALLSTAIITDVLELAHFERLMESDFLKHHEMTQLRGRWGEIARRFHYVKLANNSLERTLYSAEKNTAHGVRYELADATDDFVDSANIIYDTVCNMQIVILAPLFYECLQIYSNDSVSKELLDALGTRFTSVTWSRLGTPPTEDEFNFLKRQLESPHLRKLECHVPALTSADSSRDLIDLLRKFVKRKNFEALTVATYNVATILPGRVFFAAYKAWLKKADHEHLKSSISARISSQDLQSLTASIPNCSWNRRTEDSGQLYWSYSERHPSAAHYEMLMTYDELLSYPKATQVLTMQLSYGNTN